MDVQHCLNWIASYGHVNLEHECYDVLQEAGYNPQTGQPANTPQQEPDLEPEIDEPEDVLLNGGGSAPSQRLVSNNYRNPYQGETVVKPVSTRRGQVQESTNEPVQTVSPTHNEIPTESPVVDPAETPVMMFLTPEPQTSTAPIEAQPTDKGGNLWPLLIAAAAAYAATR